MHRLLFCESREKIRKESHLESLQLASPSILLSASMKLAHTEVAGMGKGYFATRNSCWLDAKQVAAKLGIGIGAVHSLDYRGTLPHGLWVEGRKVWDIAKVEAYKADPAAQARKRVGINKGPKAAPAKSTLTVDPNGPETTIVLPNVRPVEGDDREVAELLRKHIEAGGTVETHTDGDFIIMSEGTSEAGSPQGSPEVSTASPACKKCGQPCGPQSNLCELCFAAEASRVRRSVGGTAA